MNVAVCLWWWLVAGVSSLVVHQPDGIVSIITELEPEKAPVAYLQAVDRHSGRPALAVHETPPPPLAEGEFRVRSEKIQVVDPETGFKVVHHVPVPKASDGNERSGKHKKEDGERRSGIQRDSTSDIKLVYPSIIPEGFDRTKYSRRFNKDSDPGHRFQRQRKIGEYGYQYPKKDNTLRTEETTRIKNNDEPTKVYKHTIVRPVRVDEDVGKVKKFGKIGRYEKFIPERKIPNPIPGVGEVIDSSKFGSAVSSGEEPARSKALKEYSSRTVVKYPDGYAQGDERRVESSSKYKTASNSKDKYRTPTRGTAFSIESNRKFDGNNAKVPTSIKDKIEEDQPLQEAGSLLTSGVVDGIDDGLIDEGELIYTGGGYSGGGGYEGGGGYGGGTIGGFSGHGGGYREGFGEGFGKEKHFEKIKGKEYISAHNSAQGGKGQKGYNNEEGFAKGQNEQHGQEGNKGFSVEKDGEKKSHLDKSSQFASGHQASEGAKGADYHKENGHRKGHKKSGFRKVHHKDEFKKNEEFYDEEHNSGKQKQEGHRSQEHAEKSGGSDKKAYLDAGKHQASREHEGEHERGQGYKEQNGYHKDKGHSGHYGNEEEYGKKSGHKEGEVHGHSEFGGHH